MTLQREAIAAGNTWQASPQPNTTPEVQPLNMLAVDPAATVEVQVQITAPGKPPYTITLPAIQNRQRITVCRVQGNIWAYRELPARD